MNKALIFAILSIFIYSCGQSGTFNYMSKDSLPSKLPDNPSVEYLRNNFITQLKNAEVDFYESKKSTQVLYLNFNGAEITKGYEFGQSYLLCKDQAKIPRSELTQANIDEVLKLVSGYFQKADVRIMIVADQPNNNNYTTLHIGGTLADIGCPVMRYNGLTPIDLGNINKSDVGFVFTHTISDVPTIAKMIAQEAGHAFGLQKVDNPIDIMSKTISSQVLGFFRGKTIGTAKDQDAPKILHSNLGRTKQAPEVKSSTVQQLSKVPVESLNIEGLKEIAALGMLLEQLRTYEIGDASELMPRLQSLFPTDETIDLKGINELMTVLGLVSGAILNSDKFKNFKDVLLPEMIVVVGGIPGLGQLSGYLVIAKVIIDIIDTINKKRNDTSIKKLPTIDGIPDLTLILGLQSINNVADLVSQMDKHFAIINLNYTQKVRDSLLSLIKIAYGQRYKQLNSNE